ncbi:hypothetical protein [Rothia sp. ZJ1223]|uniref:hypothetical protein n=1 Tax=Rothia sp. ZJ1223 TaxID=2811098 RepID=UPI00195EE244|nr:hypothetical protein [Rothia sp. ZJ1223]MBM7051751.1 hypothetical protein [Rothia sp. ZJ1223]
MSVYAAGFVEPLTVCMCILWFMVLLDDFIRGRMLNLKLTVAAGLGTGIGFLLLFFLLGSQNRQSNISTTTGVQESLKNMLTSEFPEFLDHSYVWPWLIIVLTGFFTVFIVKPESSNSFYQLRNLAYAVLLFAFICLVYSLLTVHITGDIPWRAYSVPVFAMSASGYAVITYAFSGIYQKYATTWGAVAALVTLVGTFIVLMGLGFYGSVTLEALTKRSDLLEQRQSEVAQQLNFSENAPISVRDVPSLLTSDGTDMKNRWGFEEAIAWRLEIPEDRKYEFDSSLPAQYCAPESILVNPNFYCE